VGTAHVLCAIGAVTADGDEATLVLEEHVGDVPVRVRFDAARPASGLGGTEPTFAELSVAQLPVEWDAPAPERLAEALSLDPDALLDGEHAPRVASCGLPFTLVAVRDRDAVARARVAADAWARAFPADAWGRGRSEGCWCSPAKAPTRAWTCTRASSSPSSPCPRTRPRGRRTRRSAATWRAARRARRHAALDGGAGRRDGAAEPAGRVGRQARRGDHRRARGRAVGARVRRHAAGAR
jgi:hypothetical protein